MIQWIIRIFKGEPWPMQSFWEDKFDELAEYNSRVANGIAHTPEKVKRMKDLQSEYDKARGLHSPAPSC